MIGLKKLIPSASFAITAFAASTFYSYHCFYGWDKRALCVGSIYGVLPGTYAAALGFTLAKDDVISLFSKTLPRLELSLQNSNIFKRLNSAFEIAVCAVISYETPLLFVTLLSFMPNINAVVNNYGINICNSCIENSFPFLFYSALATTLMITGGLGFVSMLSARAGFSSLANCMEDLLERPNPTNLREHL